MKLDDHELDHNASPVNPLPLVVVLIALVIFGIELVFQAGNAGMVGGPQATGWRLAALERWGFYEPLFDWMWQNGTIRWDFAARMVSYAFFHGNFTHMIFTLVFILALGKMVGETFSGWAVFVIFLGATVMGAVAYGLVWDTRVVLIGAYPAAYGLIGAYSFLLWTRLAGTGAHRMTAFALIGFLMAIQLLWGLLFGGSKDWIADIAGFVTGFLLSFVVSPGGWRLVLARIRQR